MLSRLIKCICLSLPTRLYIHNIPLTHEPIARRIKSRVPPVASISAYQGPHYLRVFHKSLDVAVTGLRDTVKNGELLAGPSGLDALLVGPPGLDAVGETSPRATVEWGGSGHLHCEGQALALRWKRAVGETSRSQCRRRAFSPRYGGMGVALAICIARDRPSHYGEGGAVWTTTNTLRSYRP